MRLARDLPPTDMSCQELSRTEAQMLQDFSSRATGGHMDKEGQYKKIWVYVDHVVICQESGLFPRQVLSVAIWDCQNRLQKTSHL